MRLLLTVVTPDPVRSTDVAVQVDDDATVGSLAALLGLDGAEGLWLGAQRLEPARALRGSPLRDGAVVGAGRPVPGVLAEPDGSVEVLVASGPGAGRVHRLRAGSVRVGSAADCELRLGAGPAHAAVLDVGADGTVGVRADAEVAGRTRPAAARARALPGPFA
ncbi:hypothetical protein GTQ99_18910, partial [Kineococcus sp. T13]